ncbi:MAG: phenylalanine--tRNA ligase subunit beta [Firmicutes bacterium]|nr:phenylalanine--tRNA ligase subunit beta [Bacillota bacterium]
MRVSYNWLREFIDLDGVAPHELAERLTMVGLAAEGVNEPGKDIKNVYTGKILNVEPHPNADKLVICQVITGGEERVQIVTGAPNVSEGLVVPVAVVGAKLAGGLTIKRAKLRGVESRGMLCSGQELGLDPSTMPEEQATGIMILPGDTPVGVDVKPLIGLDDVILELELTPNRGDCLSILGVAREVAAILNRPLKLPPAAVINPLPAGGEPVRVDIQDPELCRRYVARLLKNVRVGPSPAWLQHRLRAVGVRPISNVVDVTNYVMMELGQPMHAFDYHKLQDGHVMVRRAVSGETIVSLDNVERKLAPGMLVITDPSGPVAVAGVMGGFDSEVTENTTAVLLESAYFNPVSIRKTARDLALHSESSSRFEHGIDITGCLRAADRAAGLLAEMGAAEVADLVVDNYPAPAVEKTILVRPERVRHVLDVELGPADITGLLTGLQFEARGDEKGLLVTVPGHRSDITIEEDLLEEIARLHGYNRVPDTLPTGAITTGSMTHHQLLARQVRNFLSRVGFYEVMTYSFTTPGVFDRLGVDAGHLLRDTVPLQNPLSEEQSVMRTLLFPGLLDVLQRNVNRRNMDAAIFEMGRLFFPSGGAPLPREVNALAVAVTGKTPAGWNSGSVEMDFYFLKGALGALLENVGVNHVSYRPASQEPGFHPGRAATIYAGEQKLGVIGELHPDVLDAYNLKQRITVFEFNFDLLAEVAGNPVVYKPLPKFPGTDRDLALLVRVDVPASRLVEVIRREGGNILRDLRVFDVYRGEQVAEGYRSIAFSLQFQAADRTLTDEEVSRQISAITGALEKELGVALRE